MDVGQLAKHVFQRALAARHEPVGDVGRRVAIDRHAMRHDGHLFELRALVDVEVDRNVCVSPHHDFLPDRVAAQVGSAHLITAL